MTVAATLGKHKGVLIAAGVGVGGALLYGLVQRNRANGSAQYLVPNIGSGLAPGLGGAIGWGSVPTLPPTGTVITPVITPPGTTPAPGGAGPSNLHVPGYGTTDDWAAGIAPPTSTSIATGIPGVWRDLASSHKPWNLAYTGQTVDPLTGRIVPA